MDPNEPTLSPTTEPEPPTAEPKATASSSTEREIPIADFSAPLPSSTPEPVPAPALEAEPVPEPCPEPEPAVQPCSDPVQNPWVETFQGVAPTPAAELSPEPAAAPAPQPPAESAAPVEAPAPPARTGVRIQVSALTDIGCVRTNNEDFFGYNEEDGVYVVCDGMGGMASGEIASASAATNVLRSFAATKPSGVPVSTRLLQAIIAANAAVWQQGQLPEHKGMGTTLVAAAVDGEKLVIGNVGDSRAYMVEPGHCIQLTVDHSYINELIRNGTLTIESARNADLNGMQSVITRAIGAADTVQPDFFSVDLRPGLVLLLTTDGLTRYLLQDEILMVLNNSTFETGCANLIQLAKQRGGQDNITCLLLRAA